MTPDSTPRHPADRRRDGRRPSDPRDPGAEPGPRAWPTWVAGLGADHPAAHSRSPPTGSDATTPAAPVDERDAARTAGATAASRRPTRRRHPARRRPQATYPPSGPRAGLALFVARPRPARPLRRRGVLSPSSPTCPCRGTTSGRGRRRRRRRRRARRGDRPAQPPRPGLRPAVVRRAPPRAGRPGRSRRPSTEGSGLEAAPSARRTSTRPRRARRGGSAAGSGPCAAGAPRGSPRDRGGEAAHPVLGHHVDEAHGVDDLAGLLGHLADDRGVRATRPGRGRPPAGSSGPVRRSRCQLGEQQPLLGGDDGVGRDPLVRRPAPSARRQPRPGARPVRGGSDRLGPAARRTARSTGRRSTPSTDDDRTAGPAPGAPAVDRVLAVASEHGTRRPRRRRPPDDGDHARAHPGPAGTRPRRGGHPRPVLRRRGGEG